MVLLFTIFEYTYHNLVWPTEAFSTIFYISLVLPAFLEKAFCQYFLKIFSKKCILRLDWNIEKSRQSTRTKTCKNLLVSNKAVVVANEPKSQQIVTVKSSKLKWMAAQNERIGRNEPWYTHGTRNWAFGYMKMSCFAF